MIRILKLNGETMGTTYICAMGQETGKCTIGRYDENAMIAFLCRPHMELYDFKIIKELDFDLDNSEHIDAVEAFEVLEIYGNPETNHAEMNEAFEIIWDFINKKEVN